MLTALKGRFGVAEVLLRAGVNPNVKNVVSFEGLTEPVGLTSGSFEPVITYLISRQLCECFL